MPTVPKKRYTIQTIQVLSMATIPPRTSWFRASLCNADQVSTCGCWRNWRCPPARNKLKTHLKTMPPERIGHECCWIDVGASTREQAGQSEISTRCPLALCIDTCLPTSRQLHKVPKRCFSRTNPPQIRLETS